MCVCVYGWGLGGQEVGQRWCLLPRPRRSCSARPLAVWRCPPRPPARPPHPRFQRPSTANTRGSTTPFGATQLIWMRDVKRTWGGCGSGRRRAGGRAGGGERAGGASIHAAQPARAQPAAQALLPAQPAACSLQARMQPTHPPCLGTTRRSKSSGCRYGCRGLSAAQQGRSVRISTPAAAAAGADGQAPRAVQRRPAQAGRQARARPAGGAPAAAHVGRADDGTGPVAHQHVVCAVHAIADGAVPNPLLPLLQLLQQPEVAGHCGGWWGGRGRETGHASTSRVCQGTQAAAPSWAGCCTLHGRAESDQMLKATLRHRSAIATKVRP